MEVPRSPESQTSSELQDSHLAEKTPYGAVNAERNISIKKASQNLDVQELARIATLPGGFLTDELRRQAWPILLGVGSSSHRDQSGLDWHTLPKHRDEPQIELDVNRSFVYYPNDESETKLEERRVQLSDTIVATLREHPMLCYFQGYHDIVQVMLLVLGEELAQATVPHLSILRIRDFMLPVLSPSFEHLQLVPAIVTAVDIDLAKYLTPAQPFFALSSTLTMFAHNIEDYQEIARLFDFLLAHEASLSMYFFAAIILSRRKELFDIEPGDADMLHFTLSKLPQNIDIDDLIERSVVIFRAHPPEKLPLRAWTKISSHSVLKTTRSRDRNGTVSLQTLEDGITLFGKQARQLERQAFWNHLRSSLWVYRRSIGGVGLAVFVSVISIWIQRNAGEVPAMLIAKAMISIKSWFF